MKIIVPLSRDSDNSYGGHDLEVSFHPNDDTDEVSFRITGGQREVSIAKDDLRRIFRAIFTDGQT